jgi:2-methylcitrate dehydratase
MDRQNEDVSAHRAFDQPLVDIANYVADYYLSSSEAYETARYVLLDSVACALRSLRFPECANLLGPIVPGAGMAGGARVPGTGHELDPAQAAFAIGTQIGWLEFNDTWLAAECGHPSENLGTILAVGDWLSRRAQRTGGKPLTIRELLTFTIKAHEIHGCYALRSSFARVGIDQTILVRIASTAVATAMLGGSKEDIAAAVSNAWLDGGPLRAFRHGPQAGSRRGWAAGDACRRAVLHALDALRGETGYPAALSAPTFGFHDAVNGGQPLELARGFGSHVIENVMFRVAHPGAFLGQAAIECTLALHPRVSGRLDRISKIVVEAPEAAAGLLDRADAVGDRAARSHCLRYLVAVPLVLGRLRADDFEDDVAADPRVAALQSKVEVRAHPGLTAEHQHPDRRYAGGALQVIFDDGTATERILVERPLGHRERRVEAIPLLIRKFEQAVRAHCPRRRADQILALVHDVMRFENSPVHEFLDLLAP